MSRKGGWGRDEDDYYDEYDDDDWDEEADACEESESGIHRGGANASSDARASSGASTRSFSAMRETPKMKLVGANEVRERERAEASARFPAAPRLGANARFAFDSPSPDAAAAAARGGRSVASTGAMVMSKASDGGAAPSEGLAREFASKARVGGDGATFAGYEASSAERAAYSSEHGDVHVVVLGHVDAGKSTLCGRLLYALKAVDDRAVHKNARDAKAIGKASFAWAWVMDSRPEERERGVTIDVSVKRCFLDESRQLVVLDAPGHRDFVPSAISGMAQADAGMLVIDGAVGGFENGFEASPGHTGQTREHARLAKSLGLHSLIVVVNKMDCVDYSDERFQHVTELLTRFLVGEVGFTVHQLTFIPVSGIDGANISPIDAPLPAQLSAWYRGPTLIDALRAIKLPPRGEPKPLRMPIADIVTEVRSLGSVACGGKIESGSLTKGQLVSVMPANVTATVKCIEVDGLPVDFAGIGTSADVGLVDIDPLHLQVGSVLCHASYPMTPTNEIEVCVLTTDVLRVPLLKGSKVVLHSHMLACDAVIEELVAQVDTVTGEVIKSNPRCITREQSAILRVKTSRNVCVEPAEVSPTLSRVTLRMGGKTMALGVVRAIWR